MYPNKIFSVISRCTPYIYSLDDEPEEGFLIPYTNRGHEAGAYLSYLTQYYDSLHEYTIFIHGREEHWHNDVAGPKTLNQLPILRMQAVQHFGYVNLRRLRRPGCPSSLRQDIIQQSDVENQNLVDNFDLIWTEIMGTRSGPPPDNIGHMCCGQFAVAKEIILNRPISDYERFIDWVAKTQWSDNYGIGWMMEKLWHIIFQMPANHCSDELQCRCDLYGWCGPNPLTGGVVLKPVGS
ncbi:hypothetical protein N7533_008322 [Penicillium manginii]|uniref:uncharacterized protein n=1 Tax=Penicillium manginii TaxID=203109 RepID=UPI00254725D5|nr:uncharacterized protein N7533_008322 [Penicillium manginii]KAJ5751294.1 hypothetical protein N7533_008322 [Penicillium manginii]